jgi:hypothetical protein
MESSQYKDPKTFAQTFAISDFPREGYKKLAAGPAHFDDGEGKHPISGPVIGVGSMQGWPGVQWKHMRRLVAARRKVV